MKQELHPKAVHLLDKPEDLDENGFVPDYPVTDDMILLKGYFELGTGQSESEIRESITEVLKQRFPFVRPDHFDFVKRERNKVTTPVVGKSLEWNYKHVKELCGQGKLYIRLNVLKEVIEACDEPSPIVTKGEDDEDLMKSPFFSSELSINSISKKSESALANASAENGPFDHGLTNMDSASVSGACTSADLLSSNVSFISSPSRQSDMATLGELLPSVSEEDLDSLVQIINILGNKLTGKRKKLEVDEDDLIEDAVAYYKSIQFDASCPLRIIFRGQPAIDSGGVLRQFYSNLFEGLVQGKLLLLFEGEEARKVPSYQPQAVMSGMFEMVGKMIAHSLVQGGPGFPCLALPCFYYLVTGDVMCAFAYCDVWDLPCPMSRNIVLQLMDVNSYDELGELAKNGEVINLMANCGETSVLQMSTKGKIIQSIVMYEVISKRKMALDQLRKGLITLGVLDEMSKHPHLFESVFTFKPVELTPAIVRECLKYPDELSDQAQEIKMMMNRFVDQSSSARLMQLMQYCTGSKMMPSVQNFAINVNFHCEDYISSSTCTFTLLIPDHFHSYGLFELSLNSAFSSSGKSFTLV